MANDFLAFATGVGANVIDQATYDAAPWVGTGFQSGLAQSAQLNKVWRQGAAIAAGLSTFIINQIGGSVLDDGDTAALAAKIASAVQQASLITPTRIVTSSATLNLTLADGFVGLRRTAAVSAMTVNLPAGSTVGQEFGIQDIQGDPAVGGFSAFPVTVVPPVGDIAGAPRFVMNEDRMALVFRYFGSNIWGVHSV